MSSPLLARVSAAPQAANLAAELEEKLSAGQSALLKAVADYAEGAAVPLFLVGGFVRDLLLDEPSSDFDLVVESDAIQLARDLASEMGGKVVAHPRFGTANWYLKSALGKLAQQFEVEEASIPNNLDLVSARQESYAASGALPRVELAALDKDLYRRDFTINALAIRLDGDRRGELVDSWDGLRDLQEGVIRVLHSASFVDDPTRILRAVRFSERFGFEIESGTMELLVAALDKLGNVSGERLLHEFEAIFKEGNRIAILERLENLGVLAALHPELGFNKAIAAVLNQANSASAEESELEDAHFAMLVWLAQLPATALQDIAERLKMPSHLAKAALVASELRPTLDELLAQKASEIAARLDPAPMDSVLALRAAAKKEQAAVLARYLKMWRELRPETDGEALKARGLKPGPRYAEILSRLRNAWLDDEISGEEEEQALLAELLADD